MGLGNSKKKYIVSEINELPKIKVAPPKEEKITDGHTLKLKWSELISGGKSSDIEKMMNDYGSEYPNIIYSEDSLTSETFKSILVDDKNFVDVIGTAVENNLVHILKYMVLHIDVSGSIASDFFQTAANNNNYDLVNIFIINSADINLLKKSQRAKYFRIYRPKTKNLPIIEECNKKCMILGTEIKKGDMYYICRQTENSADKHIFSKKTVDTWKKMECPVCSVEIDSDEEYNKPCSMVPIAYVNQSDEEEN